MFFYVLRLCEVAHKKLEINKNKLGWTLLSPPPGFSGRGPIIVYFSSIKTPNWCCSKCYFLLDLNCLLTRPPEPMVSNPVLIMTGASSSNSKDPPSTNPEASISGTLLNDNNFSAYSKLKVYSYVLPPEWIHQPEWIEIVNIHVFKSLWKKLTSLLYIY